METTTGLPFCGVDTAESHFLFFFDFFVAITSMTAITKADTV
jgi:hypothetical protein